MSSGTGEASGAGGLDLNCDTVVVLDNHEAGVEDGLGDAPVSTGGELLDRESGHTLDVGGDEKKECEIKIADGENAVMVNGEGSAGSELGGGSEVGVVCTVRREAGTEFHGGKLLEVEFGEKGNTELVSVSTVGFEDVEVSSQALNLGDGSGGDQKRGAAVDVEGVMGTNQVSLTALVGGRGTEDVRLEGSSTLRREHVEVHGVDGGGEAVNGELDLEEREPEGESITVKLMEVNRGEKEITDLLTFSSEKFEAVDASNQAVSLENVSGGDQIQEFDVNAEGPGEREAEVLSHSGKLLQVEKEDGSTELAVVSTEEFVPVEISIHTVDFHDGSRGDQKRGTDLDAELDLGEKVSAELVAVSTVGSGAAEASSQAMYLGDGSDDDQNLVTDANKEGMVRTDEDFFAVLVCGGGAEAERLEGSSNLREEQVEVDLVDGGVQVEDFQLYPEESEAEDESFHIKLVEMDTEGREGADLGTISAEDFEAVEANNQAVIERDAGGSESADLVAVSAEEVEAVEASNQAMDLRDGSRSDQNQGIDLDVEGMVIDGQLGPGERVAEVKSYSGKFLEVDKGGEGSAVLASVSTEEFQPLEASRHPMDFHDGSGGNQKQVTDLDAQGMVIDGELGSGKREAEVDTPGGKLLEVDRGENGSTVLVSASTERFELANICSQSMNLGDGSGDDQRLGTLLDAESMVGIDEDSDAISVVSGRKLLEVDYREKRNAEQLAVSTENSEPVKASSQATNLVHRSGDDQRLVTNVDAEGMVGINEDSVTISVGSGGPENERSVVSLVLRKEQVEVQIDLGDGRGQAVDGEMDTGNKEAESKSYSGRCMKVDMGENGSAKLAGPSAELSEAIEGSGEAMSLGDGSDGDQNRGVEVDTEGLMATAEVSLTVLIVCGGADNEKMEGSSILRRKQFEIQVDESDDAVGPQLGCGEREAEVDSHEGMPLDLPTRERESINLVSASGSLVSASVEEFETIEPSNIAMNSGDGSGADEIQEIDADAEGMNLDSQLVPGGRDAEVNSHSRKLLEVDKREKESAEQVAVSTEIFEPVETSSQATYFGDASDGDQMRGTGVNEEGVAIDTELSLGKSVGEVEFHSERFLEVGRDDEGSAELPAVSTERLLPCKASSEPMNLVDGCGDDQKLETDVDADVTIRTHEDSVAISIASGAPQDASLDGSLILRKEHIEVQCNLVDGVSKVVEDELGTTISVAEVKSYGERCMEFDMGEKGSTKLIAASTERAESVEASSQAMDLGDGSGSDQIQGTDAEDMVQNEASVTVLVVGGVPGNERLGESLISGKEQVEVLVHLVDGCGQVENVLVSHGEKLVEVDLGQKRKELIAASAERIEAFEVSCQTMDLGDHSSGDQTQGIDANAEDVVDIRDNSAAVSGGGGGPEDERLEEDSSVLGIGHVKALWKPVDGCGRVVDSKLIHGEMTPIVESHGGKLLKVETGAEGGDEPYAISAESFEAVEACSQARDLEHEYCGDQNQGTDGDAEYVVRTSGDSVNVSGDDEGPEDDSLARSLLLEKEHIEVLQDLMDGHDQVLDGEFGLGKREAEVETHSAKLLELDIREKGSAELASVPAGASGSVEASSQAMDVEDIYSSEQKQEIIVGAACMVGTDEDSVVVSVDGGGPEDDMLNGSSNLVKEVEVGEETLGTGSTMKDLPELKNNESAGYDIMIHATQVQTEFDGGQRQGTDIGAETMGRGTEQESLAVSVGGGGLEDERLETSYKIGEKQVHVGEDNTGPGTVEKELAHVQKIEGSWVDAMRDTGHFKDPVHCKHVEDLISREGFVGDHRTESCMESDAEPLVVTVAVADQGAEAQVLEVAPRSDGEQVKVRCDDDGSQMMEIVAHFQNSGDSVNVDVCALVEGHPDEREGGIVGDNGHNVSGVNSEFSAREENMTEKALVCLPESVEAVRDFMDHALDDRDPGSDGHDQETVVTCKKQDTGFESFQGLGLEFMGVETGIVHSTVGSERFEVLPQASSVENDPKIYDENNTAAGETVQKMDSIPVIEERDRGLQQVDGDMQSTIVSGDVEKTSMVLDAAVNVEAWSSNEHTSVDDIIEKGNALFGDNGSVMNVTSAELQNGDAQQNFVYQNQKVDSTPLMVPCREEEADVAGSHSPDNFFIEKGYSIMEDSNLLMGISIPDSAELANLTIMPQWNEPSVGCQDVRPPNIPSREQEELETEQGTPALESTLHAVDETIDCSQKLQDGTLQNLKESENQSEGCGDTSTETAISRATYYLTFPEKEGFSTSDLVWGKVKSHPWWPGQIFDFSGASQLAIKYQKKDHFLVAYFGDKTFAWCEGSRLKPFLSYFSQMEKQTGTDSFLRALCDILMEISRRVVLSMTCLCLPKETCADIKYQKVENAGVQGKTVNSVFDRCEIVNYFHPDQLLDYLRELAQIPTGGADRLEFTVAQAQLKAFYLSKGYTELPTFTNGSGLVENDFETPSSTSQKLNDDDLEHSATLSDLFSTKSKLRGRDGTLVKQKQIVEDGRKQKSLSELMEEETTFLLVNKHENASEVQDGQNCLSSGNKRKALDYVSTDIGRSKMKKFDCQADEEIKLPSPTSNSSFKVGAFISRAASKLTSGQPIRKCFGETSERGLSKTDDWSVDYMDLDDFLDVPFDRPKLQIEISGDYPPTNEMLSKLYLAARNPLKGYNFSSIVINFFCTFRNVQVSNISIEKNTGEKPRAKRGRKKKIILDLDSPDISTPDHMKDSYWSDMIIPEKDAPLNLPKRRGRKKRKFVDESSPSLVLSSPSECEPKLHTGTICTHVKHILTAERPIISVEEKIVDERTPTAVILYFNSSNSLPSDMDLIRIFSRYGPLKEEETYIERKNNSAMVVFKKRTDAEMAFNSAGKFSTFGSALLSYRLRHFPFKSSPVDTLMGEDDATSINATSIKDDHLGILVEPECSGSLDGKLCEAVGKESSIFVQSQGRFEPVLGMPPGEFSELAQYKVGDVVFSDSAPANTGRKEPLEDAPAQMETGAGSDHLLLESLDQEFSYFDLVQGETGDISGTEVGGENSSGLLLESLEVSHAANDRSLGEESRDPVSDAESPKQVAGTGASDSLAEQLENGTVLETVDHKFFGSALPAEAKDMIPDEFNIAPDQPGVKECSDSLPVPDQSSVTIDVKLMEADSIAEQREVTTVSDSTQIELKRRDPSVSITNVEASGMPSNATEVCLHQ